MLEIEKPSKVVVLEEKILKIIIIFMFWLKYEMNYNWYIIYTFKLIFLNTYNYP